MPAENPDPLDAIAATPPALSPDDATAIVRDRYGFDARARPLVSERDQNFHLTDSAGAEYVLKIANAAEERDVTLFQIEALLHLQETIRRRDLGVQVPAIIPTKKGDAYFVLAHAGERHLARIVSYLPGVPLSSVQVTHSLAGNLGRTLASLARGLAGFEHVGANQSLLWDMKRALELRRLLPYFDDAREQQAVATCLDDFATHAQPVLRAARAQVIHNDMHGDNVLVQANDPEAIAGVIDFGDMVYSPLIVDLGVAAAYLHCDHDPLLLIEAFVAGYHAVTPLLQPEIEVLVYLVKARLAATIAINQWRASARAADDPYLVQSQQSGKDAYQFLQMLNALPVAEIQDRLRATCT